MLTREELKIGIKLTLIRAEDDSPTFSGEYQQELGGVVGELRDAGVRLSPTFFTMDAVDAGGGMTGALTVLAQTLAMSGTVLAAYLTGRSGRKVRLKVGDIEAEAKTPEELEKLLAMARDYKQADEPKKILHD